MEQTPQDFLGEYTKRINTHQFDLVAPLIAEEAVFWFTDGSFLGQESIRRAFEQTWSVIQEETFTIDNVEWSCQESQAAVCIYTFHWRGCIEGQLHEGAGRGTTVLRRNSQGWQIVHEHLSHLPKP